MAAKKKVIPIFSSHGEAEAFLVYPYLYNRYGDWIGWVEADRSVYSVHGHPVGILSNEPRIVRPREWTVRGERRTPPPEPAPILPPAHLPLAPSLPVVPVNMIDVLEEAPELLPTLDTGELKADLE